MGADGLSGRCGSDTWDSSVRRPPRTQCPRLRPRSSAPCDRYYIWDSITVSVRVRIRIRGEKVSSEYIDFVAVNTIRICVCFGWYSCLWHVLKIRSNQSKNQNQNQTQGKKQTHLATENTVNNVGRTCSSRPLAGAVAAERPWAACVVRWKF